MAWSKSQIITIHQAAKAADWNTAQRYIAMKHVGCPLLGKTGDKDRRPSVSHPRNTNTHFDLLMALAESHALMQGRGDMMPRRRAGKKDGRHFWSDAAVDHAHRMRQLAQRIAEEARLRMPTEFGTDFLEGFIVRMTHADDASVTGGAGVARPRHLLACDEGQCYRIVEGLKAWVGRKLAERGMTPHCFEWRAPKTVHRRDAESAERNPEPGTRDPAASGGAA